MCSSRGPHGRLSTETEHFDGSPSRPPKTEAPRSPLSGERGRTIERGRRGQHPAAGSAARTRSRRPFALDPARGIDHEHVPPPPPRSAPARRAADGRQSRPPRRRPPRRRRGTSPPSRLRRYARARARRLRRLIPGAADGRDANRARPAPTAASRPRAARRRLHRMPAQVLGGVPSLAPSLLKTAGCETTGGSRLVHGAVPLRSKRRGGQGVDKPRRHRSSGCSA